MTHGPAPSPALGSRSGCTASLKNSTRKGEGGQGSDAPMRSKSQLTAWRAALLFSGRRSGMNPISFTRCLHPGAGDTKRTTSASDVRINVCETRIISSDTGTVKERLRLQPMGCASSSSRPIDRSLIPSEREGRWHLELDVMTCRSTVQFPVRSLQAGGAPRRIKKKA